VIVSVLKLRDVSKSYQRPEGVVRAIDGVGLEVAAGEFVAVRGASGSGKTTLLLVCGALLGPDQGQVSLDGQDPYALSPDARSRLRAGKVGFVFQQFHLIPYLSVLDNVLAASLAMPRADARSRARELIARFDMTDRMDHVPAELSTGERQRTAMARALLNRPKLLLADEPTGNLDQANSRVVLGYLAEFAKEGGAVLLVTHDADAAEYAHRALELAGGRMTSPQIQ